MRIHWFCLLTIAIVPWCGCKAGLARLRPAETIDDGGQEENDGSRIIDDPFPAIDPITSTDNITRNFVSATLGSHMVLQRDREVVLWGYSKKGATITTSLFFAEDEDGTVSTEARLVLSTTANGDDGLWRQKLPPQKENLNPASISIRSSTGQTQTLEDILFGDVYLCGGQSNMQFALPGNTNGTEEAEKGNAYPYVRVTTIGDRTASSFPMPDLQTVDQPWTIANRTTLFVDGGGIFGRFSSVCWFFAKQVADGLGNKVPIGLISNNWGGTAVERWRPNGDLYNAMIYPYMVGPMALTGFTWYQGESNANDHKSAKDYSQLFPGMIQAWRDGFQQPDAYFGFVQLSTWCPPVPLAVAETRQSQMEALKLKNVGYSTNADWGAGCNIHPPPKQYCGYRLGDSALAIQYGQPIHWKSPSYSKANIALDQTNKEGGNKPSVMVQLQDVSTQGLYLLDIPYNLQVKDFKCEEHPVGTCAGAAVLLNGKGWVNATISIASDNKSVTFTAVSGNPQEDSIVATSYGWGSVPLMTIYDKATKLPVLPWNEKI